MSGDQLKKVQIIALSYYSRKEIQRAIFDFCKNRETIANFNNKFFAKRPDCLDYPSDILNQAKKGATSFHCSEELWENPLDIKTDMTPEQYNQIKIGWDLLIDIDSKYLDYSKIAARLLIRALEHHNIKNIGIKFSGSKGFHIIIPFKAFPKELSGEETKNHFPDWARLIASYIKEMVQNSITKEILKLSSREDLEKGGKNIFEIRCKNCGSKSQTKKIGKYICENFKCKLEVESMKSKRKQMICLSCNGKMERISEEEIFICEVCKTNSKKNPEIFEKKESTRELIDAVDIVLVAPRHLFRAPYSLHEKTSLASIVINKEEIEEFVPSKADPLKIKEPKSFMPHCIEGEAKELLVQALDWARKKEPEKNKRYRGVKIDLGKLTFTEEMYPPIIKKILKGIKHDGRKRALTILLSFFTSLEFPQDFIEERITEWNKKNYHPLKEGYIKSQIIWAIKNKRLPPNYDKPIYKEFGGTSPHESGIKNPINYTIKMAMRARSPLKKKLFKQKPKRKGPEI
tara:strand:+ start:1738 stop:3285 length:1548 start_codon:yes stop_codon:yes gene_type:complete